MRTVTLDRLNLLNYSGYTVIYLKHYALVRKYSKYCENFWKRHCPIYRLVKQG